MATKQKNIPHGKEKIGSSTTNNNHLDRSHGRSPRTPKSSIPCSHGLPSDKQTSRNTVSLSNESTSNLVKRPMQSDNNGPRFTRRMSLDKPPSAPLQLRRTLSANSRDKSTIPIKPSSPSPKTPISSKSTIRSPRLVSERVTLSPKTDSEKNPISRKTLSVSTPNAPTTPRNVKIVQPISTKPKPLKRTSSNTSSKSGTKSSSASSVASSITPPSPRAVEAPVPFEVEQDDGVILDQIVIEHEILKVDDGEGEDIPFEIPPDIDQVLLDCHTKLSKSNMDSLTDTQENNEVVLPNLQIEDIEEDKTIENENQDKGKEDQFIIINVDKKNDIEESTMEKLVESEASKTMKELELEDENEGTQRLKFKESKVVEEEEETTKAEAENLPSKRQEVNKGKKESQASNEVIEETASKLVQKKKSKVLALVGAFETVMSFQDREG